MVFKVKCTNCGTWNEIEDKFCLECGYEIGPAPENKFKYYKTKILNKQAVFILILFLMIDIVGISLENSFFGNTFKIFMFVNDQLVDPTSKYYKQASIPLIIINVIQVLIFELIFYLQFYRRTQFRVYYQFYVSIPIIHWILLFFITLLLALINIELFFASLILLVTGLQIGFMHLLVRGIINKDGQVLK